MRAKIAIVAVVLFLTLSFFAVGFSALGEASAGSAAVDQTNSGDENNDNVAVAAFKFV